MSDLLLPGLIALPTLVAIVLLMLPSARARNTLVVATMIIEFAVTLWAVIQPADRAFWGVLSLDAIGKPFLLLNATVFALAAPYLPRYLSVSRKGPPSPTFGAAFLALQAAMSLVVISGHLGLTWVALEACTLLAAPLVGFGSSPHTLEALWKFLIVSSVGVALALLGTLHLAYAGLQASLPGSLSFDELARNAHLLSRPWLQSGIVLLLIGYGTKMGLAPMHTWKPDAYGEAPAIVSVVLAGGLTHSALLVILRVMRIADGAGELPFMRHVLLAFGLFSMLIAAAFSLQQRDLKRMLAYSSVEHVGILAFALGVGAVPAALLHVWCNGLSKAALFFVTGNLHRAYGSKLEGDVHGALRYTPTSAWLLCLGLFAASGVPPFGSFVSEFGIVCWSLKQGFAFATFAFLALVLFTFAGMGSLVLRCVLGEPPPSEPKERDHIWTTLPAFVALAIVLVLGTVPPASLTNLVTDAANALARAP